MHVDVKDLRDFYNSPLGEVARKAITKRIFARWSSLAALTLVGIGYTTPYLEAADNNARTSLAFMPAAQGVTIWPSQEPVRSCLVHNRQLPLLDNSIDRILCVHGLELSQSPNESLAEMWRVLRPEGKILVVVPNRSGLWARKEHTPFGYGQPYSYHQLNVQLRQHRFIPLGSSQALFMPPRNNAMFLRPANTLERYGSKIWLPFAGVILMEAKKQVYNQIPPVPVKVFKPRRHPITSVALPASRAKSGYHQNVVSRTGRTLKV